MENTNYFSIGFYTVAIEVKIILYFLDAHSLLLLNIKNVFSV